MRLYATGLFVFSLFFCAQSAHGAIITAPGQTITYTFTGYMGNGISPGTAGQNTGVTATGDLDSNDFRVTGLSDGDTTFGGTFSGGDFGRGMSTAGVNTGGLYAFDVGGGNTALGVQPAGSDFTPGNFDLQYVNNSGQTLTGFNTSYNIYINNDQGRANSLNFSYSVDDMNYTAVSSLDYTSPEAADANGFTLVNRSTSISGISVAAGQTLFLRFSSDDVSGGGSRDEFALDNITLQAVPEPTSMALLGIVGLGGIVGHRIRKRRAAKAELNLSV